jgi:endonuclease III
MGFDKVRGLGQNLLANRTPDDPEFWVWLKPNSRPSLKEANKFFLASILDYQVRAETAWENARRLSEIILRDPDRLWHTIVNIPFTEWKEKRKEYSLHRFPKAHERIWIIGERIVRQYDGDVRGIWEKQTLEGTLYLLNDLGVGEQISRMIIGALLDTGQIEGRGDVKVDIHVRRVLGRVLRGEEFSVEETGRVIEITREMHPANPWLLDRPLFTLGRQICKAKSPQCASCFLQKECIKGKSR